MAGINTNGGAGGQINQNGGLPIGGDGGNTGDQDAGSQEVDLFGGFNIDDDSKDLILGLGGEEADDEEFNVDDSWFLKQNKDGDGDEGDDSDEDDESKTLLQEIEQSIGKISIAADSIPDDFDPSDRKQLTKLLNHTAQQATISAIALMSKPTKKYVDGIAEQIRDEMGKAIQRGGVKSKIVEAFEPFSTQLKGPTLAFAKQTFAQALRTQKGDVRKSAIMTQKMLNTMGVKVNLRQGTGNNNGSQIGSKLEGADALDSFFGTPSK